MRKLVPINDNWVFVHENIPLLNALPENGTPVSLPHTWNAVDGHDGHSIDVPVADWCQGDMSEKPVDQYDRGSYWYYREFDPIPQPLPGGRLYIEIPAAEAQATVYVNGRQAAYHEGGYSCFRADITDYLRESGRNLLAVNVSNEHQTHIYPQHADFTFYGGLYRGVNLISVASSHFDLDYYGGPGILVTPEAREDGTAAFTVQAFTVNADENFTVAYTITDKFGREAAYALRPADDQPITLTVRHPMLWSPAEPNLYSVTASLIRRNEVYDEVTVSCGVRSFSCLPDKGFILNGKVTPLRGVSRHQDRLYQGCALSREDHYEDARLIKELGANTIRLAHYQHSQDFYDACDEMGFIVWAEIPFISAMNKDPKAHENCLSQMRELIIQNYNHPCICFWGLSNEVLLSGELSEKLIENHRELDRLVKSLDGTRLTTIAHVSNTPTDCALHDVSDVEGYNHYFGWYVRCIEDNGPWLDAYHAKYPDRCIGISEYGCEGILTYHSPTPEAKDYTEEYQALYHEALARVFDERPWVWGSYIWNMFDFGAGNRNEGGVAGRNNKGLITLDRKIKKDSYYIYKAYWNPEPMLHICGKRYAQRAGETTEIRVYSNQPQVALYLNDELTEVKASDKVFIFRVALADGMNVVRAEAGDLQDQAYLEKVAREPEIYTVPSFAAIRKMKENWYARVEGEDLEGPCEANAGALSIHDTIRELNTYPEAKALIHEAMAICLKIVDYIGVDFSKWTENISDKTPESLPVPHNEEGKRFLKSLNILLGRIKRRADEAK